MMDKAAAYRVFELTPDATDSDINYRYGILAKRCRGGDGSYVPEGYDHPVSFTEIEEAYNVLMDIDTRSEADRIEDEDERNEYIARQKFLNFWHYNWVKIVLGAFFGFFIVWGIIAMFTRTQADIHVVFYGEFVDDGRQAERMTEDSATLMPVGSMILSTIISWVAEAPLPSRAVALTSILP